MPANHHDSSHLFPHANYGSSRLASDQPSRGCSLTKLEKVLYRSSERLPVFGLLLNQQNFAKLSGHCCTHNLLALEAVFPLFGRLSNVNRYAQIGAPCACMGTRPLITCRWSPWGESSVASRHPFARHLKLNFG